MSQADVPSAVRCSRRRALTRLAAWCVLPWLPLRAWAQHLRPDRAFAQEDLAATLRELYGRDELPLSDKLRIGVTALAENGAVVPVKVEADLPHVEEIVLIATRNPVPLVARYVFGPRTRPYVEARVKLADTSEIIAVARSGDELVMARAAVEVTVGGCG